MRRSGRARVQLAVALAVAASLAFGADGGFAAAPRPIQVGSKRVLVVNGFGGKVCVGDKLTFGVYLATAVEYRRADGSTFFLARSTGQREIVTAESDDPKIASVSPAKFRQGIRLPQGGRGNFTVIGVKEGTTTVTFEDGNHITSPAPFTIDVVPCHYEIQIVSRWTLALGFTVTMRQTVDRMRLDGDPAVGEYIASPNALNEATAPPLGGCTATYTVPRSIVLIKATESPQRRGRFQIELIYLPIASVSIEIKCPNQPQRVEGGGQGQIATLKTALSLAGGSGTKTVSGHVLSTGKGSAGGTTTITIFKVPN